MSLSLRSLRLRPRTGGPLYLFGPPLLLLVSIPLTIFAFITTTVAFSLLAARVSIVYFELGVALLHAYFSPVPPKPASKLPSPLPQSPKHPRTRHGSIGSTASSQDTAVPGVYPPHLAQKSGSFVSLIGTSEITRDFEGVGGWRVSGDDEEEALWMGINSRLELPARAPKRHHRRSLTAGSQQLRGTCSPETIRMSPMQSRVRTPVQMAGDGQGIEDYFPPQPSYSIRPLSIASDPAGKSMQDGNRPSGSRSSSSSTGTSSRMTMKTKRVEA